LSASSVVFRLPPRDGEDHKVQMHTEEEREIKWRRGIYIYILCIRQVLLSKVHLDLIELRL